MPDPYDPGWRPTYTGPNGNLGDVGSGPGFGADLYQLYYAGRVKLPDIAFRYYELTSGLHETQGTSIAAFAKVGGREPAHQLWMDLRDELQDVLRTSSINFADTGEALVDIADRYSRTDDEAADALAAELDRSSGEIADELAELSEDFQTDPVDVPTPPAPAEYTPSPAGVGGPHEPI
jgi:hypothetical protein